MADELFGYNRLPAVRMFLYSTALYGVLSGIKRRHGVSRTGRPIARVGLTGEL